MESPEGVDDMDAAITICDKSLEGPADSPALQVPASPPAKPGEALEPEAEAGKTEAEATAVIAAAEVPPAQEASLPVVVAPAVAEMDPNTPTPSVSAAAETAKADAEAIAAAAATEIPAVQVCVRLRPVLSWERAEGHDSTALEIKDGLEGTVTLKPREGQAGDETSRSRGFKFDAVFGPERTQQDMWDLAHIDSLVARVAAGFHATVFAYGQTGSGKTHTMEGYAYNHHNGSGAPSSLAARPKAKLKGTPPDQLGIVPRAVHRLFVHAEALTAQSRSEGGPEQSFCIKASFLQIYKERIHDLLNPSHTVAQREAGRGEEFSGLRMRWDAARRQFFVENLFEYECATAEDVLQHYGNGVQNKHVASTGMNVASSRSHTILVLTLVRRVGAVLATDSNHHTPAPVKEVISKLALVDLAGSERAAASTMPNDTGGERGSARFSEAVNINQSLFVLRKVITALSKRQKNPPPSARGHHGQIGDSQHVPYRESKLTSLLQHSIGGNSFLLMLACLSPSDRHYEENLSTLQYASQAACIKNEPILNVDPKDRLIDRLKAQLAAAHHYILRITGLSQLPEELLAAPPHGNERKTGTQRGNHSHNRRTVSGEKRKSIGTWASESCRHHSPSIERGHDAGSLDASMAALASCPEEPMRAAGASWSSSTGATTASSGGGRPAASRTSSADTSAATLTPDASSSAHICPAAELLLAAGSAYKPGSNTVTGSSASSTSGGASPRRISGGGAATARPPVYAFGRPAGPPSMVASDLCKTARSRPRPPSLPPAWPTTAPKDSLPPITGSGGSCSSTAVAGNPGTSVAEGLVSHSEGPSNTMLRSSLWGSCGSRKHNKRAASHHTPRNQGKTQGSVANAGSSQQQCNDVDECSAGLESAALRSCLMPSTEAAMQSGIWDAVEELRLAKAALEEKLKGAEMREDLLKAQLQDASLRSSRSSPGTPNSSSVTPASANGDVAGKGKIHNDSHCEALLRSENEALRRSVSLLEERLEAAKSWSEPGPPCLTMCQAGAIDSEALQERLRSERDSLRKEHQAFEETIRFENEALKRERKTLQDQLDVFERALELETPKNSIIDAGVDGGDDDDTVPKTRLGEKLEKLHSQFVMEVVGLRKEVAGLKKKKWVLRSVLASGGETERKAIAHEVAELRRTTGGVNLKKVSEKCKEHFPEPDMSMMSTR